MGMLGFLVLAVLERSGNWENKLEDFDGLKHSQGFMAWVFAIALLSPTWCSSHGGLFGKGLGFYVFGLWQVVVDRYFDDRWNRCIHGILFEVDCAHVYEGGRKAGDRRILQVLKGRLWF
jgi:hypothetical protein